MESLSNIVFRDQNIQISDYNKVLRDFESLDNQLKDQTDLASLSSDKAAKSLTSEALESKIFVLESLIRRVNDLRHKINTSVEENIQKTICNIQADTFVRLVIYGVGSMAAFVRAGNDFLGQGSQGQPTATWLKVYQSASEVVILPLIYTIEDNLQKKDKLRADRVELKGNIEERVNSAQSFLEFLTHKKEVLGLKNERQSPQSDEILADLLEDVIYFRGMDAAREHEQALVSFARDRLKSCHDSPRTRLIKALERVEANRFSALNSHVSGGFQRGLFGLSRSRSLRSSEREAGRPLSGLTSYEAPSLSTLGFSDLAYQVRQSHRGSSDENV